MKNIGCIGCHQLGQDCDPHDPRGALASSSRGKKPGCAASQSGQAGEQMIEPTRGQLRRRAVQVSRRLDRPHRQGRAAAEQARRGRRASSATSSSRPGNGATEKHYLHDLIASDRRNPTVNAYGPLYGSPEYATDNMPILDPKTNKVTFFKTAGARSEHAGVARPGHAAAASRCSPRPIGATRRSGTPRPTITMPCSTRRAGSGWRRRCAACDNPAFCKKGSDHPVGQGLPARPIGPAGGDARSKDDEIHVRRHLLRAPITCSSATTPTTRCGSAAAARWSAGSTPRCSTRPATPQSRRAGRRSCSTPTATASATTMSSPTSRSIRPRTSGSTARASMR